MRPARWPARIRRWSSPAAICAPATTGDRRRSPRRRRALLLGAEERQRCAAPRALSCWRSTSTLAPRPTIGSVTRLPTSPRMRRCGIRADPASAARARRLRLGPAQPLQGARGRRVDALVPVVPADPIPPRGSVAEPLLDRPLRSGRSVDSDSAATRSPTSRSMLTSRLLSSRDYSERRRAADRHRRSGAQPAVFVSAAISLARFAGALRACSAMNASVSSRASSSGRWLCGDFIR